MPLYPTVYSSHIRRVICSFRLGYPCPTNYNPADFYIRTLAVVPGQEADVCRQRIMHITESFASSDDGEAVQLTLSGRVGNGDGDQHQFTNEERNKNHDEAKTSRAKQHRQKPYTYDGSSSADDDLYAKASLYKASWATQFHAILWRSYKSLSREPLVFKIRLIQTIVCTVKLVLY